MPKISKSLLIVIAFFTLSFLIRNLILTPVIKGRYLYADTKLFQENSWKYTLFLLLIVLVIIFLKQKKITARQIPVTLLVITFFSIGFFIGFKNLIDDILLYTNTKIEKKEFIKTFQIVKHQENKVFRLNDGNNSIQDAELPLINERRIKQNLKSVFDYNNGDTIKVKFKTGILNISYLD